MLPLTGGSRVATSVHEALPEGRSNTRALPESGQSMLAASSTRPLAAMAVLSANMHPPSGALMSCTRLTVALPPAPAPARGRDSGA